MENMFGGLYVKLDFKGDQDKLYVRMAGEIDLSVSGRLRRELEENLEKTQARHLVLDFKEVRFIDSSGLGVILGRYKYLSEMGGSVEIMGVSKQIEKILTLSGLSRIMKITSGGTEKKSGTRI